MNEAVWNRRQTWEIRAMMKKIAEISILAVLALTATTYGQNGQPDTLKEGLFLHNRSRGIGSSDPVIQRIIQGKRIQATAGETVTFQSGQTESWTSRTADSAGWFRGEYLRSGYGLFDVPSAQDRVVLLEAMGNYLVYVNGVPREGNTYGYKDTWNSWEPAFDYSMIPIRLKKGDNQLLFLCGRGMLKVKFEDASSNMSFNIKDVTVPDLLVGEKVDCYAAVTVINAADRQLKDASISADSDGGYSAVTKVPLIQPMSVRKVGFKLVGPAPSSAGTKSINLKILDGPDATAREIANAEIVAKVVLPGSTHNVTFLSAIDSSVQYYAVVPPRNPDPQDVSDNGKPKALFFSLHGADVIATNMANSYSPKTWGYIVCPTNGGPYGYDWEDWGRLDALQVLGIAKSTLKIDPNRIYLTGHSMGGHGTWILGGQYPDQFAAIGPSAGWISWWTYGFRHDSATSPMEKMLRRATTPSNTYLLDQNYKQVGLYILHGSKDDNVPVVESINMADTLSRFDKDFVFHQQMGVGHWWGLDEQAGTDCVDWPPMFDFFARHARPGAERIENIDFTTASPGVSAEDYWLTIYAQERQLEISRAIVKFIPSRNRFAGTTSNVRIISFDLTMANRNKPFNVDLDSTRLEGVPMPPNANRLWLEKEAGQWRVASQPSPDDKGPSRYGTFKDVFRHDVVFVYGSHGTKEESEWAFDKARFDAEAFWYQRGGSIDIVSDKEFRADVDPDRSVVLYGNDETNSAWNEVLSKSPVSVSDGKLTFDKKVMKGEDYACFMIRPRKGSTIASVGVVAGTGIEGMRLTYTVPYLEPWYSLPDLTILNVSMFSRETKRSDSSGQEYGRRISFGGEQGVKFAGFFGLDWSVKNGEFVEQ
jgi:dienelactone hydrolase